MLLPCRWREGPSRRHDAGDSSDATSAAADRLRASGKRRACKCAALACASELARRSEPSFLASLGSGLIGSGLDARRARVAGMQTSSASSGSEFRIAPAAAAAIVVALDAIFCERLPFDNERRRDAPSRQRGSAVAGLPQTATIFRFGRDGSFRKRRACDIATSQHRQPASQPACSRSIGRRRQAARKHSASQRARQAARWRKRQLVGWRSTCEISAAARRASRDGSQLGAHDYHYYRSQPASQPADGRAGSGLEDCNFRPASPASCELPARQSGSQRGEPVAFLEPASRRLSAGPELSASDPQLLAAARGRRIGIGMSMSIGSSDKLMPLSSHLVAN